MQLICWVEVNGAGNKMACLLGISTEAGIEDRDLPVRTLIWATSPPCSDDTSSSINLFFFCSWFAIESLGSVIGEIPLLWGSIAVERFVLVHPVKSSRVLDCLTPAASSCSELSNVNLSLVTQRQFITRTICFHWGRMFTAQQYTWFLFLFVFYFFLDCMGWWWQEVKTGVKRVRIWVLVVLGVKPGSSQMQGKWLNAEPHPQQ